MKNIHEIQIDIPKHPKYIMDTLFNNGFDAYIVGGCVRDSILGKEPSDYDITTNAKPEEIKKIFKRTIDTGIKHGTISVLFYENNKPLTYEVTTYRVDGEYHDSRHPDNVYYVDDLREDLLRRDFTINAMAYNYKRGLVDEFGGLVDLKKKIIKAVGDPLKRFKEDALRILRAIRFSANLGFTIDEDTKNAIPYFAQNISYVSKERIQIEFTKIITSNNPEYIKDIFYLGIAKYICKDLELIFPGKIEKNLEPYHAYACFLYNTDLLVANRILKELKLDNSTIEKCMELIEAKTKLGDLLKYIKEEDEISIIMILKDILFYLDYDLTYSFIKMIEINEKDSNVYHIIKSYIDKFKLNNDPINLKDLDITGSDLIYIGFSGEEIGLALKYLLKIVHKNKKYNDKKLLQEIAKKAYNIYKGV